MPKINKRKKVSNSEDEKSASSSDSGPEDRNPPPKNEATKMATASTGSAKKPDQNPPGEAEPSWQLDKQRVLKVRSWRGKTFIDIREYYEKDGQQLPGKKGISLSASQWSKLKSIIPEVDKALEEI
ncbi:RNA polymerase II transcriptional coactivator [Daphnia magna]|uniref:RNA polymerase II transcriptional coactivator n=2 Tax=Daphnia magna TaxID=35525 RepID=A0A164S6X0_9CRUS|nr:RNA polymerase II transcriptional coactivator [Daphnia magna]KAK4036596.1 hypothetical protein OUZ56_028642 [Daphnia magna]KZS09316.1 RNA polymerase II transcriptional coactivator [Daphnia magna]